MPAGPTKDVTLRLNVAAGSTSGIGRVMGGVGQGIAGAAGAVTGRAVGGPVGALIGGGLAGGGIGALVGSLVTGLFDQIKEAVRMFSPGTMRRYEMAWDDLMAVIGERFVPVIERATEAVRALA